MVRASRTNTRARTMPRDGRQLDMLVAPVRCLDEMARDVQAGLDQPVAHHELVLAWKLGDPLDDPGEQRRHPDGDDRWCGRTRF